MSQAIRIKRISSNQVDLNNSLKEIKINFVKLTNVLKGSVYLTAYIECITKKRLTIKIR